MARSISPMLIVPLAAVLLVSAAGAQPPPPAEPAAKAQAPVMTPLEITAPLAPVPNVGEGAPLFSAAELDVYREEARRESVEAGSKSRICNGSGGRLFNMYGRENRYALWKLLNDEMLAKSALSVAADRAAKSTEQAVAARRDAAAGRAPQEKVVETELARQKAVAFFIERRTAAREAEAAVNDRVRTLQERVPEDMVAGEMRARADRRFLKGGVDALVVGPDGAQALQLAEVLAREVTGERRPFFIISGKVLNRTAKPITIPPLSFTAVDQFGAALDTKVADPGNSQRIPSGGGLGFAYQFTPKPNAARTVLVTFAGPLQAPLYALGEYCGPIGGAGAE